MLVRSLFRTIKSTLGRYLSIFAIIALGVGFFIGLRVTHDAMLKTADDYLTDASVRFHERMGYVRCAHFHQCARKFGHWYDMIWMEMLFERR